MNAFERLEHDSINVFTKIEPDMIKKFSKWKRISKKQNGGSTDNDSLICF